jgi:hypothetical protein
MREEISDAENQAAMVNLSASGIAFFTNDSLELGTPVEIRMMLLPSCTGIITYGEVIGNETVQTDEGDRNQVRIDFTHLREEDRDMLIKHVIRKQGDMLRERRAARENAED